MADSKTDFPTTLGPDATFKGELTFEKSARLLGKFEGQINTKGDLTIGDGALLTGNVQASTVQVEGRVKGNLNAKSKVVLTASARLEGDLQTATLEVADGAVLIGRCMVGVSEKASNVMPRDPVPQVGPPKGVRDKGAAVGAK